MHDREQIEWHLHCLVEHLPDGVGVVLSAAAKDRNSGKVTFGRASNELVTRDSLGAAVDRASLLAVTQCVYVSTTATDCDTFAEICARGGRARGGASDARYLIALFADVDIAGDGHSAANLPASIADAQLILEGVCEPTFQVATGGGLHCWWMLPEPKRIDDGDALVVDGWVRYLAERAELLGWHLDAGVGDLARVLRVAGTVNWKTDTPRPVSLVREECRFDTSDIW